MKEKIVNFLKSIPQWVLTAIGLLVAGVAVLLTGVGIVATYVTTPALRRAKELIPDQWEGYVLCALRKLVKMWEEA